MASKVTGANIVPSQLFRSFFMGGFECSTFKRRSGQRLDLVATTKHDVFCRQDYQRLKRQGLLAAREGLRWHLIEQRPGEYNFASALPMIEAAREEGIQILWDICHYGWPDDLDIFSPAFIDRYANFARAFARLMRDESEGVQFFAPINEISFFSWGAAEAAKLFPYIRHRGAELKRHLVRAAIAGMEAIWEILPQARFLQIDPIIHIVADRKRPHQAAIAEAYRQSQYQAWEMLAGRVSPELGGAEKYLDIIGINYYPHNQWVYHGKMLKHSDPRRRPFRDLLMETYNRLQRPILIAETGTEARARRGWLRKVCNEVTQAIEEGIPIHGLCLYPIVNHPGWVDDRHCHNGLWDYADKQGNRKLCRSLAEELKSVQTLFTRKFQSRQVASEPPKHVNGSVNGSAVGGEKSILLPPGTRRGEADVGEGSLASDSGFVTSK
jgi:beta-glucosidase/6-phospho-beta-glucosidase/beta-galactosidase